MEANPEGSPHRHRMPDRPSLLAGLHPRASADVPHLRLHYHLRRAYHFLRANIRYGLDDERAFHQCSRERSGLFRLERGCARHDTDCFHSSPTDQRDML